SAVVIKFVFAVLIYSIVTNQRFMWPTIGKYMLDARVLSGVGITLLLTAIAMTVRSLFGIGIAIRRLSTNPVASRLSSLYVWAFRGMPVLVQLFLWFNLAALDPRLGLTIPFGGSTLVAVDANAVITPFVA